MASSSNTPSLLAASVVLGVGCGAACAVVLCKRWAAQGAPSVPCSGTSNTAHTSSPVSAAPQNPRPVVLVLHEATADRFIHYLLRPAAALGASEVIWIGGMQAKGGTKGTTEYGRNMGAERGVPLANLVTVKQARRRIAETYGGTEAAQQWIAVRQYPRADGCSQPLERAVGLPAASAETDAVVPLVLYFTGPAEPSSDEGGEFGVPVRGEWDGCVARGEIDRAAALDGMPTMAVYPEAHISAQRPAVPQHEAAMSLSAATAVALHAVGAATGAIAASVALAADATRMTGEEKFVAVARPKFGKDKDGAAIAVGSAEAAAREERRAEKAARREQADAVSYEGFDGLFDS